MSTRAQKRAAKQARAAKQLKKDDKWAYEHYKRDLRVRDTNTANAHKDADAAHAIAVASEQAVDAVFAKASAELDREIEGIERDTAGREKALLTGPRTRYTGAANDVPDPLPITHWRTGMPATLAARVGFPSLADTNEMTLAGALPHGGKRVDNSVDLICAEQPELAVDGEFTAWAAGFAAAWAADVMPVGKLLGHLRQADWWAKTCEAAGVTLATTETVTRTGTYCGTVEQKVTSVDVPSLVQAAFTDGGLELIFAHRTGDPAERWAKAIPAFRSAFKALGVDADALTAREDADGNVVLAFNNAKSSFPVAVAPPAPAVVRTAAGAVRNYPGLCWEFGVDARGNILRSKVADSPHVALIAQTGWGKSVLSASIIEQMRCSGAMVMLFDGKGTDHPRHLGRQPGVIWLSKEPAAHMVGMAWAHAEMADRYALVDADNDGPDTAKSFDFPPIFVLVDELPSLRGAMAEHDKKDKGKTFDWMVQDLLQKGRQCRIHLLLIAQSLYVDSLPGTFQTNITRTIFLGPVDSRSLMSDDISEEAKAEVVRLSSRIPESAKGRAVFMARGDGGTKVVQFQSFYGYSPGNTALDKAPTAEVRTAWEAAKTVSEQMPVLYDRIGIEVTDGSWRDAPMAELAATPTVIVAAADGPISGMERFDPLDKAFAGAAVVGANTSRARGRGAAGHGVHPATAPTPNPPAEAAGDVPAPAQPEADLAAALAALTPEQRAAVLAGVAPTTPAEPNAETPAPAPAPTEPATTAKPQARKPPARKAPARKPAAPAAPTTTDRRFA